VRLGQQLLELTVLGLELAQALGLADLQASELRGWAWGHGARDFAAQCQR
jgi:hypothetical protein